MTAERHLPASSIKRYEPVRPLRYTMADLERTSGIPARTIRYYIANGLLQPAYGRGPTATYDSDHLLRLQYIQRLKDERLPLKEIQERLSELTPDDIAMALKVQMEPSAEMWRHVRLHPDLAIQIRDRSPGARSVPLDRAFDLIVEYARTVLQDLVGPTDDE
jgi:DNA-binding transcriptional MerR regulator